MYNLDKWYIKKIIQPVDTSGWAFTSAMFGNGTFVANKIDSGPELFSVQLYRAADGWNWGTSALPESALCSQTPPLCFGHGRFMLAGMWTGIGDHHLYTSVDGTLWQNTQIHPDWCGAPACATAGDAGFVVLATRPLSQTNVTRLSSDCRTWSPVTPSLRGAYAGIVYANGRYVAVGSHHALDTNVTRGAVATSTDANSWQEDFTSSAQPLHAVAYGRDTFVALGADGAIVTSTDGKQWQAQILPAHRRLYAIAFGNGVFVAVGANGAIFTSRTGRVWQPCASGTNVDLRTVTFGNGLFVIGGDQSTILVSDLLGQGVDQMKELTIRFRGNGRGCVYSTPGDILCDSDATFLVPDHSEWWLRATPAPTAVVRGKPVEYQFDEWLGSDVALPWPEICQVTADRDKTVTVAFSRHTFRPEWPLEPIERADLVRSALEEHS